VDGWPNRINKAAFSNFYGVTWMGPLFDIQVLKNGYSLVLVNR